MALIKGCPGAVTFREVRPEDIVCPQCGNEVEIWSDEPVARCRQCGFYLLQPLAFDITAQDDHVESDHAIGIKVVEADEEPLAVAFTMGSRSHETLTAGQHRVKVAVLDQKQPAWTQHSRKVSQRVAQVTSSQRVG